MKASESYQKYLIQRLKDPAEAEAYLNAALEEVDREVFLLAIRNVVQAQGGMSRLARLAKLNRVTLYRILHRQGNPEIGTLERILKALGLRLAVVKATREDLRKAA